MWKYNDTDELYHYGVLGMKWHHHKSRLKEYDKKYEEGANKILNTSKNMSEVNRRLTKLNNQLNKEYADSIEYGKKRAKRLSIMKKSAKIIGGTALVAGGAYLVKKYIENERQNQIQMRKNAQEASRRLDNLIKESNKAVNNFTNSVIKNKNAYDISGRRIIKKHPTISDYNNFFGVGR